MRVPCLLRQCLPDGVSLRTAPPPPPCFYRTTVPRADGPALQLSVLQFYEPLRSYNSWAKPIWAYLTNPRVGPFSRVKRHPKKEKKDS